jgi:hypothetical protein
MKANARDIGSFCHHQRLARHGVPSTPDTPLGSASRRGPLALDHARHLGREERTAGAADTPFCRELRRDGAEREARRTEARARASVSCSSSTATR